jgi:arsenite methyltransferase
VRPGCRDDDGGKLLPHGLCIGLDLWRSADQSGNAAGAAADNARREGVSERVRFVTADMAAMPFVDACFDTVVSALAIHNIRSAAARLAAVDDAVRVLKPGGVFAIADIGKTPEYESRLRALGFEPIEHRGLGWRFWYGGPWVGASLVRGVKPATDPSRGGSGRG